MAIITLAKTHDRKSFDCGTTELNNFLQDSARQNQQRDLVRTHVDCDDADPKRIRGYYTLVAGGIHYDEADPALARGASSRYDIPIILLARLAVDRQFQGGGIGTALMQDACRRTVDMAGHAGIRALVVDARNNAVRDWYRRFDFVPYDSRPLRLYLLTAKIREADDLNNNA